MKDWSLKTWGVLFFLPLGALASCGPPEKSASGFRLPDGNVEQGQKAFLNLKCNACHRVVGLELPPPVADPPVPVALGGTVSQPRTDGELMTAIINPSHKIWYGYARELVESNGESRMADYNEVMTVQELVDLVAFLHSRYEVLPPAALR
jgi:mono/diheme cytochrome c family protein